MYLYNKKIFCCFKRLLVSKMKLITISKRFCVIIALIFCSWFALPFLWLVKNIIWNNYNFFDNCKVACIDYFDIMQSMWKNENDKRTSKSDFRLL